MGIFNTQYLLDLLEVEGLIAWYVYKKPYGTSFQFRLDESIGRELDYWPLDIHRLINNTYCLSRKGHLLKLC